MCEISEELKAGIAAYKRTWQRFDGLTVSAAVGGDPTNRQVGVFLAGEGQPMITTPEGRRFVVTDLGSLRVE